MLCKSMPVRGACLLLQQCSKYDVDGMICCCVLNFQLSCYQQQNKLVPASLVGLVCI